MEYARMRKRRTRIKWLLIFLILSTAAALSAYYYFNVYSRQIISIEDINLRTKQNREFSPPAYIKAKLRNGEIIESSVQWQAKVDTSEPGTSTIKGLVEGYEGYVDLNVSVYYFIEKVDKPSVLHVTGGSKVDLPEKVSVHYSLNIDGKEKVLWDTSTVDLKRCGRYEVTGKFTEPIESEDEIRGYVEVIDKEEAICRMMTSDEYAEKPEVKVTLSKVKELPREALEMLLKSGLKVTYVTQKITDMPEFSSLKEKSNSEMRIFGVFKYPNIIVDYTANKYIYPDTLDSFEGITIHEIGHAYDYIYNNYMGKDNKPISASEKFYNIWQQEAKEIFSYKNTYMDKEYNEYYSNSKYEYFAQCFSFYYTSEETRKFLKEKAPETYEFIKEYTEK